MRALSQRQEAAIEAVARQSRATWKKGGRPPTDAYLTIEGKRIAVEVATLRTRRSGAVTEPRLRFDRVAIGLIRRLQNALSELVPDGNTVVVTVTAPIRSAAKTAAALAERIHTLLEGRSARAQLTEAIQGNQIQVRLLKAGSSRASKLVGFVHNPDSDPAVLFSAAQSLLECLDSRLRGRRFAASAPDRWLIIATDDEDLPVGTYRQVYSQLSIPMSFRRVLIVAAGEPQASSSS